jgi:hypothetical protein
MIRPLAIAALFLLTAASAKPAPVDVTDFSVVNLQNGAMLTIGYDAQGCFHSSSESLTLTADRVVYDGQTAPLSLDQAEGLDTYLRQLARVQGQPGGCTTSVNLRLTLVRDGEMQSVSLFDDFCGYFPGMQVGLSPDHLRYDLFEKAETEQMTPLPK